MTYSDDEIKDFTYTAVRMSTKLDYRAIRELMVLGQIENHRDLTSLKNIKSMDRKSMSDCTSRKIEGVVRAWTAIEKTRDEYLRIAEDHGIFVASSLDPDYPMNWRHLSGMPSVIYGKGNREYLARMSRRGCVAVVGSRDASKYSLYAAGSFAKELSSKGIVIVSGMALGIDGAAHNAALDEAGGTVAVLAGGPETVYPSENQELYERIVDQGLAISEMPPGQRALRQYFPARNRLIAGLGDCTLIMEAGETSGTLHTASYAAGQGKEVFVLPNNIYFENALGGLKLLEDGGHVLINTESVIDSVSQAILYRRLEDPVFMARGEDIMDDYPSAEQNLELLAARRKADAYPDEMEDADWKLIIKDELSSGPRNIDELCRLVSLPFYRISQLMVTMLLDGSVTFDRGKYALTIS